MPSWGELIIVKATTAKSPLSQQKMSGYDLLCFPQFHFAEAVGLDVEGESNSVA